MSIENNNQFESRESTQLADSKPLVGIEDLKGFSQSITKLNSDSFSGDAAAMMGDFQLTSFSEPGEDWDRRRNDAAEMQGFVNKNFDDIDTDGDKGYISREELEAYKEKHPEHAQVVDKLLDKYNEIQNSHNDEWGYENDGITKKDIDAYEKGVRESWLKR